MLVGLFSVIQPLFVNEEATSTQEIIPLMDTTDVFLLIAIVLLGVIVMGAGTAFLCYFGFERGLPFFSLSELQNTILKHEDQNKLRYMGLVDLVNDITRYLKEEMDKYTSTVYLKDKSTAVDMQPKTDVGCQATPGTAATTESVIIDIETDSDEWEKLYDQPRRETDIWSRIYKFYSFRMSKEYDFSDYDCNHWRTQLKLPCPRRTTILIPHTRILSPDLVISQNNIVRF